MPGRTPAIRIAAASAPARPPAGGTTGDRVAGKSAGSGRAAGRSARASAGGAATASARTPLRSVPAGSAAKAAPGRVARTDRRIRAEPVLRLVAGHPRATRTPFVVLVLAVLGGGLIGLLLLNSAAATDSFAQDRLQRQNADLTVRQQELSREVAAAEAPGALAAQARKLGLVPSGQAGFLVVGARGSTRAVGTATAATAPPPPPTPSPSPTRPAPTSGAPGTHPTPGRSTPAHPTQPSPTATPGGPPPSPTPGGHR